VTSTQEHHQRLLEIVRSFSAKKLVIIGDSIADRFLYGAISRVSREAPSSFCVMNKQRLFRVALQIAQ
jgi:bifunctional ADP-heptose synthase (sugar kinase/adenylyltransferase)